MSESGEVAIVAEAGAKRPSRKRAIVGVVWLSLFIAIMVAVFSSGITVEDTAAMVRAAGIWGVAGYLLAFATLQPLGLSGHLLAVSSALIWDLWIALPLALLGAVCSALTCFFVGRYVAFTWVQTRLPPKLRRVEGWLLQRGVLGVIVFRALTYTTQIAMLMMGTVRVRFSTMLIGTIIGFIPWICVDVLLGGELLQALLG